jgi:DNA-damage-inducible protein D
MQRTTVALEEPEDQGTQTPFDQVKRLDEHGKEYWTGRDLQPLMDYGQWVKFAAVIEKAKASLAIVEGRDAAEHHFPKRESEGGRWGNQRIDDFRLTRFGAYLTAMAGDDTKQAVAEARIYFAVKTREAEVRPQLSGQLAVLEKVIYELHDTQVRVGNVELVQQRLDERHAQLEARVSTLEGDHGYMSALGYAKSHPPLCTEQSFLSRVGKVATRMATQQGIRIGTIKHPNFGRANTYPEHILRAAFEEVNAK